MPDGPAQNLELKVRLSPDELAIRRGLLLAACATPPRTLRHIDTYFRVPSGRLKLREIWQQTGVSSELIAYERPNHADSRWSTYERITIAPDEASALKRGLRSTLGELVVVAKTREVGLIRHSRIHLDTVRDLGTFLEIETVVTDQDLASAPAELATIVDQLQLAQFPSIGESYSDLLLAHRRDASHGNHEEQA